MLHFKILIPPPLSFSFSLRVLAGRLLGLYPADRLCLTNGKWVTDNIINAYQQLLRNAYPHIGGLENTSVGETLAFTIQKGEFVQVLHVSGCHWITISTMECQQGVVNVYDSIPSCSVSLRTKEQIAAIICTQAKEIILEFPAVQSQRGSSDCGLFALAYATSLCMGDNPVQTNYVQHMLRSHLLDCLTQRTISAFPMTSRKKKVTQPRGKVTVQLFCHCRQPEEGKMVQCDQCMEWYHSQCETVPSSVWKSADTTSKWHCKSCL